MKWTICYFVRDLKTKIIVYHEIQEIDSDKIPPHEMTQRENERVAQLDVKYPPGQYDVFTQGFSSLDALYSAFPEIRET